MSSFCRETFCRSGVRVFQVLGLEHDDEDIMQKSSIYSIQSLMFFLAVVVL